MDCIEWSWHSIKQLQYLKTIMLRCGNEKVLCSACEMQILKQRWWLDACSVVHHYVGFRHHWSELSSQSAFFFNCLLLEMKRFIPKEFNSKLWPISELSHWKAAELKLLLRCVVGCTICPGLFPIKPTFLSVVRLSKKIIYST